MLTIVPGACAFAPDMSRGTVVVESDLAAPDFPRAFDELNDPSCRAMALQYATRQGMDGARLNGTPIGPYPVNSEGLSLELVRDERGQSLPQTDPEMQPARYRVDVAVARSLL